MTETERLVSEVEAFMARVGMAESTFGWQAVNDGHLVKRLRRGGVTLAMADRIRQFIDNYGTTRATNQEATPAQP
jgi:hypothetical protein